jgi:hypothetical protein
VAGATSAAQLQRIGRTTATHATGSLSSDSRGLKPEPADWDSLLILNLFVLLMSFFSCVTGFF